MASKTIGQFVKAIPKMDKRIIKDSLKAWNRRTLLTTDDAADKTPLVTGDLQGSGFARKAKVTKKGIVSAVVFTAPYAKNINDGEVTLAPEGTVYKRKGQTSIKKRLGELGFADTAVDENAQKFVDDIAKIIGEEFLQA